MAQSFTIAADRCVPIADPALRDEIQSYTQNDDQTSGIIRSISRFGGDTSILRFEMTPQTQRVSRLSAGVSWNVKAVRPQAEIPVAVEQPYQNG